MSLSSVVCPVCEQTGCTTFFFLPDQHAVYACPHCGVEFLYPQPSDDKLAVIYSEQYFLGSNDAGARERAAALKRATAALYLKNIHPLVKQSNPRLLEVGCGSGDFLLEASAHGYQVEGLEYSEHAVETANRRLAKAAVQAGSLDTNELPTSFYDVAVAFDVIEHVRYPEQALRRLQESLKTGGLLVLATPSLDSWSRRLLGKHWMEYKTEHLTYFGEKSLRLLLRRLGFTDVHCYPNYKVLSADYINAHFQRYRVPVLTPVMALISTVLPDRLLRRPLRVVASGVFVVALK